MTNPAVFPREAKLLHEPASEYAREHMTVGKTYTIFGQAGCCVEVATDIPGDTTIINPCWFEDLHK